MTAGLTTTLRAWRRRAILALFCLALGGCVTASARRELAEEHFREGETALALHDYAAAATAYGEVWRLDSTVPLYAKRLGLVREHLKDYAGAAQVYRAALSMHPGDAELRADMTYRLALLEAFRLEEPTKVRERLATLPQDSGRAADLRAVLAILAGDGRQALIELNAARNGPLSEELVSLLYYHAARAYALVGEKDRAVAMLYEAVNHADYMPVAADIEEFRIQLTGH